MILFFIFFLQIIDIVSGELSASFGSWPAAAAAVAAAAAAAADSVLFSLSIFFFIIIFKAFKIMSVSLL